MESLFFNNCIKIKIRQLLYCSGEVKEELRNFDMVALILY